MGLIAPLTFSEKAARIPHKVIAVNSTYSYSC